nr:RNA-directed DNA polymerase, eukaryota [Tanacetum cinerariifolium]
MGLISGSIAKFVLGMVPQLGSDNIDPKPQANAPVEQSCKQVGSQTIKSGGSVLEIMEGIIQVGKSMGYTMEGCAQDLERIIGQQGE